MQFDMLMWSPDKASKIIRVRLRYLTWDSSAPQQKRVSSAKRRWETRPVWPGLLLTYKNPIHCNCFTFSSMLLRPSMSRMKRKGDRWSPCLIHLKGGKNPTGLLLTRTEYLTVEKLHLIHFSPIPICLRIEMRYCQFSLSKAFSISSLNKRHLQYNTSFAIRTAPVIRLPLIKAFW